MGIINLLVPMNENGVLKTDSPIENATKRIPNVDIVASHCVPRNSTFSLKTLFDEYSDLSGKNAKELGKLMLNNSTGSTKSINFRFNAKQYAFRFRESIQPIAMVVLWCKEIYHYTEFYSDSSEVVYRDQPLFFFKFIDINREPQVLMYLLEQQDSAEVWVFNPLVVKVYGRPDTQKKNPGFFRI